MNYLRTTFLIAVTVSVYFTASALKCHSCQTLNDTSEPLSACYDGTDTEMEDCGMLSTCGSGVGLVDVVPKDDPSKPPVQQAAAIRGCVSSLAAIAINGCITDASPYIDMVNSKSEDYEFSNFEGKICICQVDGCLEP